MIKYFPSISEYNFGITGGIKSVKNIFKSVNITVDNVQLIKEDIAYSGERPEQVSFRLYNNFNFYWLVLLLNGVKNPFDWNTILGQNLNNEDLERYDTRVLQFSNSSPFLPSAEENKIVFNGITLDFFNAKDIDSYDGVDFSGITANDIVVFETGLGVNGIKCTGAGLLYLDDSTAGRQIADMGLLDNNSWYHEGQSLVPIEFDNQNKIKQISGGSTISCALDSDGRIHCWGSASIINNLVSTSFRIPWIKISTNYIRSQSNGFKFIEASKNKIIAITNDGFIAASNAGDEVAQILLGDSAGFVKTSWFYIDPGGVAGGVGLFPDGTVIDFNSFPPTGTTLSDVVCGSEFCIGLLGNGSLTGWGANDYNQLDGIPSGNGFVSISATYKHALALKNDGTVYAWGLSANGQCNVPNKKFSSISAGNHHSAALTQNNELCIWGEIQKFGFINSPGGVAGITYSGYTMSDYTIYGKYDQIYSGDHHIILRGLTGEVKRFIGIITNIDNDFKRLTCKVFGGDLTTDELFFNDPSGTIVSVWRDGNEIAQITNKLIGIQKQKNATIEIKSNNVSIPVSKEIWKTVYILNYNTPDKDSRLITLKKIYDGYNLTLKNRFYYVSNNLAQKIENKIQQDLQLTNINLNYKLSNF